MYEGSNTKAIRSQNEIADALVRLMMQKPYDKIQITDICDEAQISRRTFYNLFDSKDEALWYRLRLLYRISYERYSQKEELTDRDIIDIFMSIVDDNRDFFVVMTQNKLTGMISDIVKESVSFFYDAYVGERYLDEYRPYYKAIFSGAFSGLILEWLTQEDPIGRDQFAQLLTDFLNGKFMNFPKA